MSDLTSAFNEIEPGDDRRIDFARAEKVATGGSLCDGYLLEYDHHRYFVKRLKKQFRGKQFYEAALEKEFEVGEKLSHRALPTYRGKGKDYIVMDYVEGTPLSEMIGRKDTWLQEKRSVEKLLATLLDVIGYLHRNNIVHCDIKPDNIIITKSTGNAVLVDLDKCHSDSMASTSGSPTLYGLEKGDIGKSDIDYRGLGLILRQLRREIKGGFGKRKYKRLEKLCFKKGIGGEELYESLLKKENRIWYWATGAAAICLIAIWLIFGVGNKQKSLEQRDEITSITISEERDSTPTTPDEHLEEATVETGKETDSKVATIKEPEEKGQEEPERGKGGKEVKSDSMEDIIQTSYSGLIPIFDSAEFLLSRPDSETDKEKREEIKRIISRNLETSKAYALEKIGEKNPGLSPKEKEKILENSAVSRKFIKTANDYLVRLQ